MASVATVTCEDHISTGSCSTQPGWGKICLNSFCATETIFPFLSNKIARELVVPWSRERTNWDMVKNTGKNFELLAVGCKFREMRIEFWNLTSGISIIS